jgi:hypothetical protein
MEHETIDLCTPPRSDSLTPIPPPSSSTIPYPIQKTPYHTSLSGTPASNRTYKSNESTNNNNNTSIFSDDDDLLTQPAFLEGWEAPSQAQEEGAPPAKMTKVQEKAAAKEAKAQEKAFERARKKRQTELLKVSCLDARKYLFIPNPHHPTLRRRRRTRSSAFSRPRGTLHPRR